MDGKGVSVKELADYLGKSERTIREYVKEFKNHYENKQGIITLKTDRN